MKQFDIKHIVKESLREAFYTAKKPLTEGFSLIFVEQCLSEESVDILTEAYGEYIKGISEEIDSWLSE